jgi:hypothetical protein
MHMIPYLAIPLPPSPDDCATIRRLTEQLLKEYLPALALRDPRCIQYRQEILFKEALRSQLRDALAGLQDKRSITVQLHHTRLHDKYQWVVDVNFDRRYNHRAHRMIIPTSYVASL